MKVSYYHSWTWKVKKGLEIFKNSNRKIYLTEFTRIPLSASSNAIDFVNWSKAALLIPYAKIFANERVPETLDILTILPFDFIKCGRQSCVSWMIERTFTFITLSKSSIFNVSIVFEPRVNPTLLTLYL